MKDLIDEKTVKFIAVGIVNTIVGMTIMLIMYNYAGCSYWMSSATNYCLTSILSFFLNKTITFKHSQDYFGSALRFTITIAISYILAYRIARPITRALLRARSLRIQENTALLVGMVFFTGFNYIGQRYFAFVKKG